MLKKVEINLSNYLRFISESCDDENFDRMLEQSEADEGICDDSDTAVFGCVLK